MKKLLCILLVFVFTATLLIACGKKEQDEREEMTQEQIAQFDYVEQDDLGGYEFRMLCRPGMIEDQYVEKQTGDIVADAVYERNMAVEALLNVKITATESGESNGSDAMNTILAGDDQYDVIFPHTRVAFQYAIQDACVNYMDISTINFDADWWSQDIINSCNVNNHLYVLDGDISTHRLSFAFCMFFNKRIFDEIGVDYPYQLALDGEWTFDEFSKLVKLGSKDLNGDGILKPSDDQFGYYTWNWYGPIVVLYTGGQRIYTNNARGIPELTLSSAKTVDIFSKYFDLTNTDNAYLFVQKQSEGDPAGSLFREGRAMFTDMGLGNAKGLRSMSDDFGILPWPKFTSSDDYATVVNGHASLMIVPVTVSDPDLTGQVLEALCAVGHNNVIPAFYEVSLKTMFSRDAESEAMIDIVKDSVIYDLGYASGGTFQSVGHDLAGMSNPDFASYYASKESQALTSLNEFIKSYGKVK